MSNNSLIFFPCKECDNDSHTQLPAPHSNIMECNLCGHPNDLPSQTSLDAYQAALDANTSGADDVPYEG